ncbi:MAG: hypothetical protein COX62_06085 [Deltaproteobacteria bacterium CG_4_10_14_0_2_um_filter_43_8]|nr:MAG: hypothetical protein COV43_07275 [Deltaproteobacteria bacterium CG11_big_fil_rev_8_21_14_0_20_42_23]PJA19770.1 MAG: hypothetical protein COX62_06085 [Deltaproteobacteria bacterium CG_4_10_14_0_2_um_filter_43_8]PJC64197.1 MAG: hypothetical protein CO021_05640 [Deltaproteobacteria bacterium CG_4_9_14_0_2_um_filter_42_21]
MFLPKKQDLQQNGQFSPCIIIIGWVFEKLRRFFIFLAQSKNDDLPGSFWSLNTPSLSVKSGVFEKII